jgi:hypothetical protein
MHLPTTRLFLWERHLVTQSIKNGHNSLACVREERVVETRDKQRYLHLIPLLLRSRILHDAFA